MNNNWFYTYIGFSRIFLLGILIFKGLTARRLYKSFGVKGLKDSLMPSVLFELLFCFSLEAPVVFRPL
jgi:hypothetical protein